MKPSAAVALARAWLRASSIVVATDASRTVMITITLTLALTTTTSTSSVETLAWAAKAAAMEARRSGVYSSTVPLAMSVTSTTSMLAGGSGAGE